MSSSARQVFAPLPVVVVCGCVWSVCCTNRVGPRRTSSWVWIFLLRRLSTPHAQNVARHTTQALRLCFDVVDSLETDKHNHTRQINTQRLPTKQPTTVNVSYKCSTTQAAPVAVYPLPEHSPDDCLARRPDDQRLLQLGLATAKRRQNRSDTESCKHARAGLSVAGFAVAVVVVAATSRRRGVAAHPCRLSVSLLLALSFVLRIALNYRLLCSTRTKRAKAIDNYDTQTARTAGLCRRPNPSYFSSVDVSRTETTKTGPVGSRCAGQTSNAPCSFVFFL